MLTTANVFHQSRQFCQNKVWKYANIFNAKLSPSNEVLSSPIGTFAPEFFSLTAKPCAQINMTMGLATLQVMSI